MKSVAVLMSTYNGEKYIREQIESVLNQKDVKISLFVRDDGSKDNTINVLSEYERRNMLKLYLGHNYGFGKSFISLLKMVPKESDYYAFCDQDDIWMNNKMSIAIDALEENDNPCLYCALPKYVDSELKETEGYHSITDDLPYGHFRTEWSLTTGLVAIGCTMVFNKQLACIVEKGDYVNFNFGHDNFMSIMAALVGDIIRCDEKVLLYRRHGNNSGGEKKRSASFLRRFQNKIHNFNDDSRYQLRYFVMNQFNEYMNTIENREKLELSLNYRKSLISKIRLLTSGWAVGLGVRENIKFWILVIFNKY